VESEVIEKTQKVMLVLEEMSRYSVPFLSLLRVQTHVKISTEKIVSLVIALI